MHPLRSPRPPAARRSAGYRPPPRRRPSRRTFVVRRIIVGFVALALLAGVVSLAKSVLGDDTSTSALANGASLAADSATSASSTTSTVTAVTAATAVTAPETPTTVTPTSDPSTVPTAADPARVLLVGDSEAGGLSPFLQRVLDPTGVVAMTTDYKVSSGLVRPDFFDWPAHLRQTVPAANPDIVVALFGGNDGQGFLATDAAAGAAAGKSVDTAEWRAEYGARVGAVMDMLGANGRTLIWVGVPNGENPSLTASLAVQNEVVKAEAAKRTSVAFVDSWDHFTGIDGGFAPYIADPRDGESKPVRSEKDGFHLNTTGEEILAFYVGTAVISELRHRGAGI